MLVKYLSLLLLANGVSKNALLYLTKTVVIDWCQLAISRIKSIIYHIDFRCKWYSNHTVPSKIVIAIGCDYN